jgi:hypothetical protein
MADNFTSPAFLANYCQGLTPFNPTLITFDLLYNAGQTIISYSFTASSTWVIIDQEGRIVFRETDTAPEMIDEIKTKIEELLSP